MLFSKWKIRQIEKLSNFRSFNAIFVKFSTDFVDWNVEKSQQGTSLLSSSLFRRDSCNFQVEKHLKLAPKIDKKTQNFETFKVFMHFLSNF